MSIDQRATGSAHVSVTVTEFNEIGGRQGCSHADIELTDTGDGRVSQSGVNNVIEVHAEVYLNFSIRAREGDPHGYVPIGIGLRDAGGVRKEVAEAARMQGCGADPLGQTAFPRHTIAARGDTAQLTILDTNPEAREFEFNLVIQRSDGLLSVIDPKIRNRGVNQ